LELVPKGKGGFAVPCNRVQAGHIMSAPCLCDDCIAILGGSAVKL
jgi:hypothetical protein